MVNLVVKLSDISEMPINNLLRAFGNYLFHSLEPIKKEILSHKKVLLVDDLEFNITLKNFILIAKGMNVTVAKNGKKPLNSQIPKNLISL